jgi:hypothetical protein
MGELDQGRQRESESFNVVGGKMKAKLVEKER